jgi:integrase
MSFDELLNSKQKQRVLRFTNGYQPNSLNAAFTRLMKQNGLLKGTDGQNRTLYSLRHTSRSPAAHPHCAGGQETRRCKTG